MHIVTVFPIKKGAIKETLSYLANRSFEPGSVIDVPVRKDTVKALVLNSEKAENKKAEIKDMTFELRKIEGVEEKKLFRNHFIEALKELSKFYVAPLGSLIMQSVSEELLAEEDFLSKQKEINGKIFEALAIQNTYKDRFEIYRSLIRESFAKKQSVFFVLPTEEQAKDAFENLKKGIDEYAIIELFKSKKKTAETIKKIMSANHSLLIVGTVDLLPLIPSDTGTIIVENEHSRFWRKRIKPFLDGRELLYQYARKSKIRIFFGSLILRIKTHQKIIDGWITEYGHMISRVHHPVKTLVVDLKKTEESVLPEQKKTFKILSDELKEMVSYAHTKNKKMFIFGSRRGLSPQTICLDCGNVVLCDRCEAPVVLHKKVLEEKTVYSFICHHCGMKRDALEKCTKCDSWRLEGFGIGTQKIAGEIEKITGKSPFIIDSDNAKTGAEAKKIVDTFLKKGGIIVGTEMIFDYLKNESIDYSAIASFDSIFSLPDFRTTEHVMRIILETKMLATDNILIQGRNIDDPVIEMGLQGDIAKFVKEELSIRKKFAYPPFRTFIKISIKNKKEIVKGDIEIISNILSKWEPTIFPAFIKTEKGKTIANILISLPNDRWPDEELRDILLSLPPYVEVKVDPESML